MVRSWFSPQLTKMDNNQALLSRKPQQTQQNLWLWTNPTWCSEGPLTTKTNVLKQKQCHY